MHHVDGIGGFFLKARDSAALSVWYADRLGVSAPPDSYDDAVWCQSSGPTVFAPFGLDQSENPHLGANGWGINFRVSDLDGIVEQLRTAGETVDVDPELYPNGRFAQLRVPNRSNQAADEAHHDLCPIGSRNPRGFTPFSTSRTVSTRARERSSPTMPTPRPS